jgi:hypothetical protein
MRIAIPFLITLALCLAVNAAEIHVSPRGDDAGDGSPEKPLLTLTAARDKARALRQGQATGKEPIQVLVHPGEYMMPQTLELSPLDSGTDAAPLVFRGLPGQTLPVFYGGFTLKGFTKVTDRLWKVDVPLVREHNWLFEQLYINGRRATRARTPNEGRFFNPANVQEMHPVPGHEGTEFATQYVTLPAEAATTLQNLSEEELGRVTLQFYHLWNTTRRYITAYDPASNVATMEGAKMRPVSPLNTASLLLIENSKNALDAPGEWYLDPNGTLFYRPLPDETPENTVARVPVLERFISIAGDAGAGVKVSNIYFENLAFRVAGYRMPPGGNDPAQAAAHTEAVVQIDMAERVSFSQCEIAHTGTSGIWFRQGCTQGRVERSLLYDLGASGIKIGVPLRAEIPAKPTSHIVADNNIVQSGGHVFPSAVGIVIFQSGDNQVTHNSIADFRYSGVSVGWTWGYGPSAGKNNLIAHNHIHHLGWGLLSDLGGVYTLGTSDGTVVRDNLIHHIYSHDYGGNGIYTDEGSSNLLIENNLVYANKSASYYHHYGKNVTVKNNIFAKGLHGQLQAGRIEEGVSVRFTNNIIYWESGGLAVQNWADFGLVTNENIYWCNGYGININGSSWEGWQARGRDQNSFVIDPGFADTRTNDFRPYNKEALGKIRFEVFDPTKAGVYGSEAWKQRAQLDPKIEAAFQMIVR